MNICRGDAMHRPVQPRHGRNYRWRRHASLASIASNRQTLVSLFLPALLKDYYVAGVKRDIDTVIGDT